MGTADAHSREDWGVCGYESRNLVSLHRSEHRDYAYPAPEPGPLLSYVADISICWGSKIYLVGQVML